MPVPALSLGDQLGELLAEIPELKREVRELRARVETWESRSLQCPGCGGTLFTTTKTSRDENGVIRRIRRCRDPKCGKKVTTREAIG